MTGDIRELIDSLPRWLTLQQLEDFGICSTKAARRAIAAGQLKAVKVGVRRPGTLRDVRRVRVPRESLAEWLTPVGGGAR